MGKNGKKDVKAQRTKKAPAKGARVNDLPVKDATSVKGGTLTARKAGGGQEDYLKVTMSDILISS